MKVTTLSNICTLVFVVLRGSSGHIFPSSSQTSGSFWGNNTEFQPMSEEHVMGGSERRSDEGNQAKFFFRKLMRPLVDESWELIMEWSLSSDSIFFASCFPSSTLSDLKKQTKLVMSHTLLAVPKVFAVSLTQTDRSC